MCTLAHSRADEAANPNSYSLPRHVSLPDSVEGMKAPSANSGLGYGPVFLPSAEIMENLALRDKTNSVIA